MTTIRACGAAIALAVVALTGCRSVPATRTIPAPGRALPVPASVRLTATAASHQLVYVCPALPCAGGQELEVFDHNGAPIFSVGETGGAAVFGDNASVYAPGSVTHPAVVLSWESPAAYDAKFRLPTGCVAPAIWESPADIWACQGGKWVVKVAL